MHSEKKKNRFEIDMCNGSIMNKLISFSIPLMISGILQLAFNAVDIVVVGRFSGSESLAAVGSTTALINVFTNLFIGISLGANVLAARFYAAGREKEMSETVHTAITFAIISGVVMALVGLFFSRGALELMGTPDNVINLSTLYMKIYFLGMPFFMLYNYGAAILRAVGDTKRPLLFLIVAGVINACLNLLLVIAFHLGVAGVAIATVTAQAIVMSIMIVGIVIQKKENVLKGTRLLAKIPWEYLQGICKIGIPTAIQGMAYCAISMVLTRMISGYGAEAVATQRVGGQIESISWNTADGFAAALNAFIAQNYGAGKNDRVKKGYKASLWTVGIWGLLISAVFICIPEPIARIFFHEPKAIATSVEYLIIIGFSEAFMCVELTTVGALSGLGRTRLCSIISIAFTSARIPLSIILGGIMGLDGIWWAISSTSIVKGIIFTCTFLWITRKRR